ncbi:hypothetical protein GCM10023321_27570 [Pseudonocardia eucalypti]|uniref:HTH luxR-type domain-containing protein n=1 Tax=Pseudonocardia eucalypti TaxID=648755 RepID=A0ABP9Q073_9PSEU|nr:DNA-binding CsgD family transcriptional regulator [Pseudonocardia eucalypti]
MDTGVLDALDYERVFAVLERCDQADSVPDFADRLLTALSDQFGLRHTTFFTGPTFHQAFGDVTPLLRGQIPGMFDEYHADWCERDAFDTAEARRALRSTHVASLREMERMPHGARGYFEDFLFKYGLYSATGMWLSLPGERHALIGLFDPDPTRLGERELLALRRMGRQLNVISRGLPAEPVRAAEGNGLGGLSRRQREVAELVAEGLTNAAIGRRLCLAEDTVKKYVSRALASVGCRSRTELALLVRARGTEHA